MSEVYAMREEKKKKRKRILSVVLAVTMGMSMLTGCGASEKGENERTYCCNCPADRRRLKSGVNVLYE